jgi:hypothetical protein
VVLERGKDDVGFLRLDGIWFNYYQSLLGHS